MLIITESNFQEEVVNSSIPVVLDFSATWCGPCRALEPVFENVAARYEGRVKVGKVDLDQSRGLAQKFGVRSVPCLIGLVEGEALQRMNGFGGSEAPVVEIFESLLK